MPEKVTVGLPASGGGPVASHGLDRDRTVRLPGTGKRPQRLPDNLFEFPRETLCYDWSQSGFPVGLQHCRRFPGSRSSPFATRESKFEVPRHGR
jgi:hypothetical protein